MDQHRPSEQASEYLWKGGACGSAKGVEGAGRATPPGDLELLRDGPLAVVELAEQVAVTQQAVSQHLKVLEEAGYAVRPEGFAPVEEFVRGFWNRRLAALKKSAEE